MTVIHMTRETTNRIKNLLNLILTSILFSIFFKLNEFPKIERNYFGIIIYDMVI